MDISEENYQKAIAVVWDTSSGSVSNLQRKLHWGYCRAAAAIDRMQKEFIVSPMSASGRRDVYPSDIHQLWKELQAAKAQAVPEGRTDFEIINQTIELVDLLALSTNVFQRDPKSKVHPFESENPRVMEWWRTACQIQELLTNTDPDNCDFEEYKAMIEAQEQKG